MGPQHPSTHGVFRMNLRVDGETIVGLKPVMGYMHRNHEKIGERNTYLMNFPFTDRLDYFTTAYFHRPEELRREVEHAGLDVEGLYGIEGPGWILPDLADRWKDPARRAILLETARALESEPSVIGCSAHLLVVGRRPRERQHIGRPARTPS